MSDQLNKKQLYEQKKQQKLKNKEAQYKEKRKNQFFFLIAVAIPLIIVAGVVGYIFYIGGGKSLENIGEIFQDQGRQHIKEGEEHPSYNSNPPTSGWHYDNPVDWGAYKEELSQERLVHNLEHGGVVIQYNPKLDSQTVKKLEELKTSGFECKLVVAPNKNLDKNIALTAWRRLYKSDLYDEKTVKAFIEKYRNTGPEFVPC